ncbi:oligosaccharide flippase family protein [Marinobacter koreensis]|nr:oligosaccharide flippase family protein [Marinobacter koreensis]
MLVARLLTPEEIGTYALASGIIVIMAEFKILGAGEFLIRERNLSKENIKSALALTIIVSWSLGLAIIISAPYVSDFYSVEGLKNLFYILSIGFFFAPFISIPFSILTRDLRFLLLLKLQVFSASTNLLVTLVLIFFGFSYLSLAVGQLSSVLVQFIIINIFMRPSSMTYVPTFSGMKVVAKFGAFNSSANLLKRATVVMPDLLIGKFGTTFDVGIFSRGLGFIQFVSQTLIMGVNPVALPYLAQSKRDEGLIEDAYTKSSVLLGALVLPVLSVSAVASLPAIRLFFGDQWDSAAPLASWLALWAGFRSIHWFANDAFVAVYHEKVMVFKDLLIFFTLTVGVILTAPNLLDISKVFVLGGAFEIVLTSVLLKKYIGLTLINFYKKYASNFVIASACGLLTILISKVYEFDTAQPWKPAIAISLIMPPFWILLLFLFKNPLFLEIKKIANKIFFKT